MNLHNAIMKNGRLAVCIRDDSAEILGFRYGLTLGIVTIKVMASTGIFVRVVCALKRSITVEARHILKHDFDLNKT
jgi:hypothetical protein